MVLKKNKIAVYSLLVPFLLRSLLFDGKEILLTITISGFQFFTPNLFFLLYILLSINKKPLPQLKPVIYLLFTQYILSIFGILFAADYGNILELIFVNQSIFIIPLILLLFPLNDEQIQYIKWPLIITFLLVCFQIAVFSYGIINYSGDYKVSVYGEILRPNTSVGSCNYTGPFTLLLGIFILDNYLSKSKSWVKYIFVGLLIFLIPLLQSRATFIFLLLFLAVFLYKQLLVKRKLSNKVLFVGFYLIFFMATGFNFLAPILERNKELEVTKQFDSGRIMRINYALNTSFIGSPLWGVGSGNVYPVKDIQHNMGYLTKYSKFQATPHNYWIVVLCEQGIIGFILSLIICIKLIKQLDYRKYSFIGVISIYFIVMNSEAIIINDEFLVLFYILITTSILSKQKSIVY